MILAPPAALRVEGVTAGYRGAAVLREVTFEVAAGQVLGLVGPNGSGKSTLLDVVCGSLRPAAGHVWLFGRDVTRLPVHRRARLGLGRTFQRLEPFGSLDIADNLLVAAELSGSGGRLSSSTGQPGNEPIGTLGSDALSRSTGQAGEPASTWHPDPGQLSRSTGQADSEPIGAPGWDALSRSTGQAGDPASTRHPDPGQLSRSAGQASGTPAAVVHDLLRRFGLVDFAGQPLAAVPTGVARIVEIARALAAGARVLLLDEPSSGMSEQQVKEFAETVRTLRADGLCLVLVEHDPELIDAVCDDVLELSADHTPPSRRRPRPPSASPPDSNYAPGDAAGSG